MSAPVVPVQVMSIYQVAGHRVPLPGRMARATPDTQLALHRMGQELAASGGALVLSDLYRRYDMQLQAFLDWQSRKKSAYSPAPGGSMHEAGRAFDLDLDALGMPLSDLWVIAARYQVVPIIPAPVSPSSPLSSTAVK